MDGKEGREWEVGGGKGGGVACHTKNNSVYMADSLSSTFIS